MDQLTTINDYLLSQSALISFTELFLKLSLSTILGLITSYGYINFSSQITPSNKYYNYITILAIIVTIIIAVVKGSLALSLGLVGALSIVRFRTAVKEPNELLAFFAAIALGISVGSNQYKVAVLASFFILGFYYVAHFFNRKKIAEDLTMILIKTSSQNSLITILENVKKSVNKSFVIKSTSVGKESIELLLEVSNFSVLELDKLQKVLINEHPGSEFKLMPKIL